jgi:universal stress protein E
MATGRSVRSVLAAVADPAASGQVAARKAVELAWLFGADVVLYHACYEPSLAGGAFFDSAHLAAARRDFVAQATQGLQDIARALGEAELEIRVRAEWQRAIPEAIARTAAREGVDIVVAEPRYRSSRRHRGLSRIDWEVARLCPVPLLLARSAAPYTKPKVLAAVDPGAHGLRVSSLDVGIVGMAATIAGAASGTVRVVHSVRDPSLASAIRPAAVRRERQRVKAMVRHLARDAGLAAKDVRIADGDPVEALLDAVTREEADILVMGTIVHGAVRQLLIGSTTEQLMHVAPCDLLLVKPNAFRLAGRGGSRS